MLKVRRAQQEPDEPAASAAAAHKISLLESDLAAEQVLSLLALLVQKYKY